MVQKKLFIFDLDGTLVDAYTAIWKSVNFTLKKLSYPPVSYQKAKRNVGKGDKRFMEAFFPKKDVEKALVIYRSHHERSLKGYSHLMPYAKRLLAILRKNGKRIAIASNRPRYFTNIIISTLGLNNYVDYILCADEIKSLKPKPKILNMIAKRFNVDKKDTVFIGDMDIDLETARRAGIDAIFIKGGSSNLKEIKKYKNKRIVSSLKEICEKSPTPLHGGCWG